MHPKASSKEKIDGFKINLKSSLKIAEDSDFSKRVMTNNLHVIQRFIEKDLERKLSPMMKQQLKKSKEMREKLLASTSL